MTDGGLDFTFECIGNVKTMVRQKKIPCYSGSIPACDNITNFGKFYMNPVLTTHSEQLCYETTSVLPNL